MTHGLLPAILALWQGLLGGAYEVCLQKVGVGLNGARVRARANPL